MCTQVLVRGASVGEDRWVAVPHVSGGVVVQLGQMLQRWTDDRLLATPHRVLLPRAPAVAPSRLTLACFFQPPHDTIIAPPGDDKLRVYEPVTAATFACMARTDGAGRSLKLTSNILKDGSWVGLRAGGALLGPPNVPG